jgi:hypothetical protein
MPSVLVQRTLKVKFKTEKNNPDALFGAVLGADFP